SFYEGGNNCNALCGTSQIAALMRDAVLHADSTVDFGQFDNDGPDGIPNSGDDDGAVDLAVFVQPEVDGACGGNQDIWSHRFSYQGWSGGPTLATKDTVWANAGHTVPKLVGGQVQFIQINNYTIQSGVGGLTACDGTNIMAIGTTAHETGHGFGLPDFYDTNPTDGDNSEGIGHWGLMGSGNYAQPHSPAYMEGFSRMTLGWVTVRDITPGTYSVGSYSVADTIFRVTPPSSLNSRGEYYLLENRQGTLSDSALINLKGPGLLIFHVDPLKYNSNLLSNSVNTGSIHALKLEQADGQDNLGSSVSGIRNRGDAGDPYPGSTGTTLFGFGATPDGSLNGGTNSGVLIDSFQQVVAGGTMSFRLRYDFPLVFTTSGVGTVAASGTIASGTLMTPGDSVTLSATSSGNQAFINWTGDTTTQSPTLKLHMTRSWTVVANFFAAPQNLVADSIIKQLLGTSAPLTSTDRQYLDLLGNRNGILDLGDFVAWLDKTGTVVSNETMRALTQRARQ
ncbi:MAG TPA: immune inhibitor A domain-containing protein, partial [Gemmatimonadales bacterium]